MTKKLSDLIFNGAKKAPPTERGWWGKNENGELTTCAISAAAHECGLVRQEPDGTVIWSEEMPRVRGGIDRLTGAYDPDRKYIVWPEWFGRLINVLVVPPDACKCHRDRYDLPLSAIVQHMHDAHRWSREAAAMWVESIEKGIERAHANPCPGWGGRAPALVEVRDTVKVEA